MILKIKGVSFCFPFRGLLLILLLLFYAASLFGQGVKGKVTDSKEVPLPFATIYFPEINLGASTNVNGEYEIKLAPGKYLMQVQYIGYEKVQKAVDVTKEVLVQNFALQEQTMMLGEVSVKSRQEDPAYTIMRKAISKRKYHLLQYDSYEVKVYMKGTGELQKAPFFLRKKIEEEGGVKLNEAYTMESIREVKFTQPNKIEEKVISIRTTGEDMGTASPSMFINESFYQDKVAEVISPLAGSAFAYYKFRYEGSFMEGDIEVNKIRVIPRSKGEQVVDGYIYIIDDLWAIHSLDFKTSVMGV